MSSTASSTSTGTITLSGFFSGMDTEDILSKIKAADEIPITVLESQAATLTSETSAYKFISSSLTNLQTTITALADDQLYKAKTATSSSTTVATATADTTSTSGTYTINITQVATATTLQSGTGSDTQLSAKPAASATISSVGGMDVSNKTFSINGVSITLTGSEVIDDGNSSSTSSVIGKINNSGAGVTATYDATTGKFTLTSNTSSTIILGSGSDTSNFLTESQLFNNGSTTVTSSLGIARLNTTATLSSAGLATTPTTGTFTVNGVSISVDSTDTLKTVLSKINSSSAGVVATYDSYTDRITLTSSTRGAQSITVADGTSNLATALRLKTSDSTTTLGKSTKFTVGSDTTVRQSLDETLTESETGIAGLTVTALTTGSSTITIAADTTNIEKKINAFIDQYNSTQNLIASYIKIDTSSTSATSDTTVGILAGESTVSFLPSDLRGIFSQVMSGNSSIKMLSDLGIETNSTDNTVTSVDSTKLANALNNNMSDVVNLFTNLTSGVTATMTAKISAYNSSINGSITNRQQNITDQQTRIADQITQMQERVDTEIARLRTAFADMESAYSTSQSILTTLTNLSKSSSSS